MIAARLDALLHWWSRWSRPVPQHAVAWGAVALAVAAAAAHWALIHPARPWGLWSGDAHEYAIIARRLADGEGFTTGAILPSALRFGAGEDHPSLLRAPLWPLALAGVFALTGPEEEAVHVAVLLSYLAAVGIATALAASLAGAVPGALAGLAVAMSPQLAMFTADGVSEAFFALWVALAFLLCARGAHGVWIGAVCGLAYLTRYNGALLMLPAFLALARRPAPLRGLAACCGAFVLVASPWWVRNWLVTGDPFYTLYRLSFWFLPELKMVNTSLWYMLDPDRGSPAAMHPLRKLAMLLGPLVAHWPLASANLVACAGLAWGCWRREPLCIGFAGLAVASTLIVAMVLPAGRYFVPLIPALLALAVAVWWNAPPRVRAAALALLLLAPLLPRVPGELEDMRLYRDVFEAARRLRAKLPPPDPDADPHAALARCLEGRPLVLAQEAPQLAWRTDAIAISLPASRSDFWEIVSRYPVRFAKVRKYVRISRAEFESAFAPRPDCAPDLYEYKGRRPAPPSRS